MKRTRGRWLQRELLQRLMLPLLGIVVLSGLLSTYSAHSLIEEVFDRWLLDAARSLATQVHFVDGRAQIHLSPQSEALLTYDVVDRVSYEVTEGSTHLLGQSDLPTRGANERSYSGEARAFDSVYANAAVRVATVPVQGPDGLLATVSLSETRSKRERAMHALILVIAPVGVLVLVAALAISSAVRRTVRPLERMASRWSERSHTSLAAMPTQDVPRELMPFAEALNDLFDRVRELLVRERHFASTAAHQLRTPLTGLQLGLARAMDCPDLFTTRIAISELAASTQRAARVVQQLLALSRLDPGARGAIALQPLDLLDLTREVGEAFMDAALQKDIDFELESDVDRVIVQGERDLLSDALGNLLDNAIRYTPSGGRITLSIHSEPPSVSVSDSGPRISIEDRAIVFERFVRGQAMSGEGSGLGLAIVKEIAALHHADVILDEAALLEGNRFSLIFGTDTKILQPSTNSPDPEAAAR